MFQPLPLSPLKFYFIGISTVLTPTDSEDVMEYVYQFIDAELVNFIIIKTYRYARDQNILWTDITVMKYECL